MGASSLSTSEPARPRHLPALTRADQFIALVCVAWFFLATGFVAHPTTALQLGSMLLIPFLLGAAVVSVVLVFSRWRRQGVRALIPLFVCRLVAVAPFEVARPVRAAIRAWAFPSYERLVARIESGAIPVSGELHRVDGAESSTRFAYAVLAGRDSDQVVTVEILTGGGFPVKHDGYLYCSAGTIEPGSLSDERWKRRKDLGRGWFEVSD